MAATSPREWLRASVGCTLGLILSMLLCLQFFPQTTLVHLCAPLAASAVLLFAVPSGAMAQPWSVLASYLISTLLAAILIKVYWDKVGYFVMRVWHGVPLIGTVARLARSQTVGLAVRGTDRQHWR